MEQRFPSGARTRSHAISLASVDSDIWPGWTPPVQDSLGHHRTLAQRDSAHSITLQPTTGGQNPRATRGTKARDSRSYLRHSPIRAGYQHSWFHSWPPPSVPGQCSLKTTRQVSPGLLCRFRTFDQEGARISISFMPPDPKVSGLVVLIFGLFTSVFLVFGPYASLYGVCRVVRPWPSEGLHRGLPRFSVRGIGSQHAFRRNGRGRLRCPSAFSVSPNSVSRPVTFFKSFF